MSSYLLIYGCPPFHSFLLGDRRRLSVAEIPLDKKPRFFIDDDDDSDDDDSDKHHNKDNKKEKKHDDD